MKELPINLCDWEVHAILDGRKTQVRRVMKPQGARVWPAECPAGTPYWKTDVRHKHGVETGLVSPFGNPGERLWVREAWRLDDHDFAMAKNRECPTAWLLSGRATENGLAANCWWARPPADQRMVLAKRWGTASARKKEERGDFYRWRPSIHMPRWASRITLEVVSVRVERVQDIGEMDCYAEGRPLTDEMDPVSRPGAAWFRDIWDTINSKRDFGWDANPWVWVVEFRRVAT